MFSFLLQLFERLNKNGISLTTDEKRDIIYSLLNTDISDKNKFRYAVISNASHNLSDREKVLQILDNISLPEPEIIADIKETGDRISNDIKARKEFFRTLFGDRNLLEIFLNNLKDRKMMEESEFLDRLYDALVWENKESDFFELIRQNGLTDESIDLLLKISHGKPDIAGSSKAVQKTKRPDISFVDFRDISNEDLDILRQSIKSAAAKLRKKIHNNYRQGKTGILDIHKTLRANAACENIPFKLRFRKKRLKRRDIVVLCDMSQSVRNSALIMISFLNELSLIFRKVRSFAFVSDITEITQYVSKKDLHSIINSLLSGGINNIFGNSNYSLAFYKFFSKYQGILDKNTVVIIIGDGRNNFNEPNLSDLKNIRRRTNRLYWFVPEPRELWGKGDSQLPVYLSVSDKAFTTTNIAQLSTAIMKISV